MSVTRRNTDRFATILTAIAVGVSGTIIATTAYVAIRFLTKPFDPTNNASDFLWAIRSMWGNSSICPATWSEQAGGTITYDCSNNMPAMLNMAWHVHTIEAWLWAGSLAAVFCFAGIVIGIEIGKSKKQKQ